VDSVGFGGLPDAGGEVTLDASIMDHAGRCGAVACLRRVRQATRVARRVMERTPHVMLAGEAATRFALGQGFAESNLLSVDAARKYAEWRQRAAGEQRDGGGGGHDTIGMLALDAAGKLAGACSTSGRPFKLPGRVGDSPIIGAGLYVDGRVGAATATGEGEQVMKVCGSFAIVENMRRGMSPREAVADALWRVLTQRGGDRGTDVSFLALRADGEAAGMSLRPETNFRFALITPGRKGLVTAECLA
jgi:isoaspartyl peptidase/L-asparaginase-like protein (Ntn-hydrolase superfamily)